MWRIAQAVYMPQASAYLPDENDSTSNDAEQLDTSKPETWPLLLPSAIPKDDRSPCYKGVVETELFLRLAQLQDALVDLRLFRRALRNLRLYFKTNMAGEGQKTQTKSRTIETGVNNRIKRSVWRYRIAYHAHFELDPTGDWTYDYRELRDEDNRGPLKEVEETGTGDGRYAPSWIWAAPSTTTLPSEGSAAEKQEINETARYEWMTCRARADRWNEEVELLQEEMRRVLVFLDWKSGMWFQKVGARAGSCTPDVQYGIDAYARRQANIHREIAISFASQWLPYLNAFGCETAWAADLAWVSEAVSRKTKLPRWFPAAPTGSSQPPPATGSSLLGSSEGLGVMQESMDTRGIQNEGGGHSNGSGEGADVDGREEDTNDEYRGYDNPGYNEDQDADDEYRGYDNLGYSDDDQDDEGYDVEGYSGEGRDNSSETDGELGFEYDDEYMS